MASSRTSLLLCTTAVAACLVALVSDEGSGRAEAAAASEGRATVPNRVVLDEPTWVVLDLAPKRRPGQWIHPVASATEKLPEARSRRFGASRPGKRPGHCRRGHCGVDLTGPRGTPIVAVLPGTVTRVERSRRKRSGRYVKIEHTDGSATSYMHLDRIAPGLAEGQKVDAGHMLGTLGRTGIRRSDPHLHFQLEVPRGRYHRYVDPEPMLNEAVVIDVIDIQLAKTE